MCAKAGEYDSRGEGWYCHRCNRYNEIKLRACKQCAERRCGKLEE